MTLILAALLACTGGDPVDSGTDGGTDGGDSGDSGEPVQTITLGTRFQAFPGFAPLHEARVCWHVEGVDVACGTTAVDGSVALEVPAEQTGAVTVTHEDIAPVAWAATLGAEDIELIMGLDTPERVAEHYAQAGVTPEEGQIYVTAWNTITELGGLAGTTATLSPASGEGPLYDDVDGNLDPELTATSTWGAVYWMGVDPGDGPFTIEVTDDLGNPCTTDAYFHQPVSSEPIEVPTGFHLMVARRCDG